MNVAEAKQAHEHECINRPCKWLKNKVRIIGYNLPWAVSGLAAQQPHSKQMLHYECVHITVGTYDKTLPEVL